MVSSKLNYEANLISQSAANRHNFSHLFKYLHSMSKSRSMPQLISYNGSSATSSTKKAELFNQYFNSVYHSHSSNILSQFSFSCTTPVSQQLQRVKVDEVDVYEVISSLDASKAICGHWWYWTSFAQSRCCLSVLSDHSPDAKVPTADDFTSGMENSSDYSNSKGWWCLKRLQPETHLLVVLHL